MEIIEGKFYKTRDGRKVGPAFISPFAMTATFGSKGNHESGVWVDTGRAAPKYSEEEWPNDIVAEWQDEPKKEISDMSEVKFKVESGNFYKNRNGEEIGPMYLKYPMDEEGFVFGVDKVGYNGVRYREDGRRNANYPLGDLVEKTRTKSSTPEPNTKWVFNDGQDFVVRVVGFNDKGQIVLETLSDEGSYDLGEYFSFEGGNENFGHFYNPWVEKVEEPKQLVGYVRVVKSKINGRLDFDVDLSDTEEEARDGFDSWDGAWELVDVVKVEWSE